MHPRIPQVAHAFFSFSFSFFFLAADASGFLSRLRTLGLEHTLLCSSLPPPSFSPTHDVYARNEIVYFFLALKFTFFFLYLSAINYAFDHTSALCLPRSTRNIFPRITFDHPRQTDRHAYAIKKDMSASSPPHISLSLSLTHNICVISTPISISISSLSLTTYTISLNLNRVLFFFRVAVEYYLFYLFIAMPMPICLNRYLVPFEVKNRVSIFFFFSFLL